MPGNQSSNLHCPPWSTYIKLLHHNSKYDLDSAWTLPAWTNITRKMSPGYLLPSRQTYYDKVLIKYVHTRHMQ